MTTTDVGQPLVTDFPQGSQIFVYKGPVSQDVVAGQEYSIVLADSENHETNDRCHLWPVVGPSSHDGNDSPLIGRSGELPQTEATIPAGAALGDARMAAFSKQTYKCVYIGPIRIRVKTENEKRCEGPFHGGLYGQFSGKLPDHQQGCEIHHMPSAASVLLARPTDPFWTYKCGPAIVMHPSDHQMTGSHNRSRLPPGMKKFQEDERQLISSTGSIRDAFEHNVQHVRDMPVLPVGKCEMAMHEARLAMSDRMYGGDGRVPCSKDAQARALWESSRTHYVIPTIRAFATGAVRGVPYQLVLGNDGGDSSHGSHACMVTVDILNPAVVFASPSGVIGTTGGTVKATTPLGPYQLCFKDTSVNNSTGTGGASFTVI